MRVSFYNYRRMNRSLGQQIKESIDRGLRCDDDRQTTGYQSVLEGRIARVLCGRHAITEGAGMRARLRAGASGGRYAVGTSSGTAALQFALLAADVGRGDEVITISNTYIGALLAISNTGATPVFADIRENTMLMDTREVERMITPRTKAIMPVHLYGQMTDMRALSRLAKRYSLKIIEDAAHAPLARYDGKRPGHWGEAACYSFHSNKNLGAATNGGLLVTRKRGIFRRVCKLRDPSSGDPLLLKSHRTPAYLDWIQSAFAEVKARHLKKWTDRRREIADRYREAFADLSLSLPEEDPLARHAYCEFAIQTRGRDRLRKKLARQGVETAVHYPPVHLMRLYRHLGYRKGSLPVTERVCGRMLSLPVNPYLTDAQIDHVISSVRKNVKRCD